MDKRPRSQSASVEPRRNSQLSNWDLYADPSTRAPSIAPRRERSSVQIELPKPLEARFNSQVEKQVKERRRSDSIVTQKLVKEWTRSADGKKALEDYHHLQEGILKERQDDLKNRTAFTRTKLRPSSIYSSANAILPPDQQVEEQARERIVVNQIRDFDRMPTIFSTPPSGAQTPDGVEILQSEEAIKQRLDAVAKEWVRASNEFEQAENGMFKRREKQEENDLEHNIEILRHSLYDLYDYVLEAKGGPTGAEADGRIREGSRQAYELDKLLLTRYYFHQKIDSLQRDQRNEKNLQIALAQAEKTMRHFATQDDGLEHSCLEHPFEPCPACYDHGEHLHRSRSQKIHEKVLELGLYRIVASEHYHDEAHLHHIQAAPKAEDKNLWNIKYFFAAFATKLVETRSHVRREVKHERALSDQIRRTAVIFVKFHQALEEASPPPSTLRQAQEIFSNTFEHYATANKFSVAETLTFCKELREAQEAKQAQQANDLVSRRHNLERTRPLPVSSIISSRGVEHRGGPNSLYAHQVKMWNDGYELGSAPRENSSHSSASPPSPVVVPQARLSRFEQARRGLARLQPPSKSHSTQRDVDLSRTPSTVRSSPAASTPRGHSAPPLTRNNTLESDPATLLQKETGSPPIRASRLSEQALTGLSNILANFSPTNSPTRRRSNTSRPPSSISVAPPSRPVGVFSPSKRSRGESADIYRRVSGNEEAF